MNDQQNPAPTAPNAPPITPEEFYRRYVRAVRAFFRRQGFNTQDVDELTHDAFARAFEAWPGVRKVGWTWLHTVMNSVWKNHLRRCHALKRDVKFVSLEPSHEPAAPSHGAPDDQLNQAAQRDQMLLEARKLPERMRACLLLHIEHDLPMRAIADQLGITEGAVKAQIHEARERLKRVLGPESSER